MITSPTNVSLERKPGFFTLAEMQEQQKQLHYLWVAHPGELLFIEMNYLERTSCGVPRIASTLAKATTYVLARMQDDDALLMAAPVTNAISWEKHRERFVYRDATTDIFGSLESVTLKEGDALYRIVVGTAAIYGFLDGFTRDPMNGGDNDLVVFWKAAHELGVDISEVPSVSAILEERRKEALHTYVRGKAILFADEPSGVGVMLTNDARNSVSSSVSSTYRALLAYGLTEQEIAEQARSAALEGLGL